MCEKCQDLQTRIDRFRRVLAHNFDPLTTERLRAGLAALVAELSALHPEANERASRSD
jgi:hypothetical protein